MSNRYGRLPPQPPRHTNRNRRRTRHGRGAQHKRAPPADMIEQQAAREGAGGDGKLNEGDEPGAAFLQMVRDGAGHPGRPGRRHRRRQQAPEKQQAGGCQREGAEVDERQGHGHQHGRKADQHMRHMRAQDRGDQRGSGEAGKADAEQHERQRVDAEMRDVFEKRSEIGRERELPHEEQDHRRHAAGEGAVAHQAERPAERPASAARHPGQGDGLPDEGGNADRHDHEERAAPSDQAAEEAAKWGRDHCGQSTAALQHGKGLGHVGTGGEPRDDRRPQRPVAADRHADQGAAEHEHEVVGRKGDRQARRHQHDGIGEDHPTPVETREQHVAEQGRDDGEEARDRDRLTRLACGTREVVGDRRQQAHRHEFRRDEHEGGQHHADDGAPRRRLGCRSHIVDGVHRAFTSRAVHGNGRRLRVALPATGITPAPPISKFVGSSSRGCRRSSPFPR
ncbi:hypothetical protein RHECNPAF_4310082 [Rhizobium etli CNPAF512]|nr:hypothetical protein RHECNPAF_4310082 [Rhizobium etli CNPAF512]